MHWIVQENVCQEQKWNELIESLERFNTSYSIHKLVPFSGDLIPEPVLNTNKVFCYGSTALANTAKRNNWIPGVIEVPDYGTILSSPWEDLMLNRSVQFYYMWQLPDAKLKEEYYFIKPDNDSKFISGQVMSSKDIKDWANRVVNLGENDGSNVNKDSMVILSTPKNISKEARFWIVNDTVVTWSMYKLGKTVIANRLLVDADMLAFAHRLCYTMAKEYWRPANAYCVDICEYKQGEYRIVEINNINNSGLYDSDTRKLVANINEYYNGI